MNEQKKYSLTSPERETIILFSDEDNRCEVYTCSRPIMTKLDKLCKSNPDSYKLIKKDSASKTYETDKRLISFRSETQKRQMTEARKKAAAENLKKARAMKIE